MGRGKPRAPEEMAGVAAAKFKPDRAAMILVDAAFIGDSRAAERHNVSSRTIRDWRERLDIDAAFASKFQEKLKLAEGQWAGKINGALASAVEFVRFMTANALAVPESLEAINESMRILVDTRLTLDLLNARISDNQSGTIPPKDGSVVSTQNGISDG